MRAGLEIHIQELRAGSVFRTMGLEVVWTVARGVEGRPGECGLSEVKGGKGFQERGRDHQYEMSLRGQGRKRTKKSEHWI